MNVMIIIILYDDEKDTKIDKRSHEEKEHIIISGRIYVISTKQSA